MFLFLPLFLHLRLISFDLLRLLLFAPLPFVLRFLLPRLFFPVRLVPFLSQFVLPHLFLFVRSRLLLFVPLPFVLQFLLPRLFFPVRLLPFLSRFVLLHLSLFVRSRLQLFVPRRLPFLLISIAAFVPMLLLVRRRLLPRQLQLDSPGAGTASRGATPRIKVRFGRMLLPMAASDCPAE